MKYTATNCIPFPFRIFVSIIIGDAPTSLYTPGTFRSRLAIEFQTSRIVMMLTKIKFGGWTFASVASMMGLEIFSLTTILMSFPFSLKIFYVECLRQCLRLRDILCHVDYSFIVRFSISKNRNRCILSWTRSMKSWLICIMENILFCVSFSYTLLIQSTRFSLLRKMRDC